MKTKYTDKLLKKFAKDLEIQIKRNLEKYGKNNTGKLHDSIKVSINRDRDGFEVILDMEAYGEVVDKGRRKGMKGMPVNKLKEWIQDRKLKVKDVNGNELRMTDTRLNSLSYVINKSISEKGIKPTYFYTEPVDRLLDKLGDDIADKYGDDIVDTIAD